jgi:alpha,alpha-trehalase
LIWIGDVFGRELRTPECGDISAAEVSPDSKRRKRSAVELSRCDAKFVKRWEK